MVASDDAEKAMEIVVKLLVQTPGCSSDDIMAAYKEQKLFPDVNFRHFESSTLRESLERVVAKSSNI